MAQNYSHADEVAEADTLAVIGAGVGRTGTNSLKIALEILLKKPCYHLKEIYIHRHQDISKWTQIDEALQKSPDGKIDRKLCHEIFSGYGAAVDHPVCAYFKELLEVYPNAKVILTTRDPEVWLMGCRSTILPRDVDAPRPWSFYALRKLVGLESLHEMYMRTWQRVFGKDMDFYRDTAMLEGFVNWDKYVRETVEPDRLLVFDISQGWGPLCHFLNVPVPTQPFPHVNEYKELRRLIRLEKRVMAFMQWILPGLLIMAIAMLLLRLFRFW